MDGIKWVPEAHQSGIAQRGELALRDDGGLQTFLLRSARKLPAAQSKCRCNANQCGNCGHPKLQTCTHGIICPMKYFVIFGFVGIIGALGSALYFMMRGSSNDQQKSNNMFRALALRVGFSILLFACILLAWQFGYIKPTGIPTGV